MSNHVGRVSIANSAIDVSPVRVRIGTESRPTRFHDHSIIGWHFLPDGTLVTEGKWLTRSWSADEIRRYYRRVTWARRLRPLWPLARFSKRLRNALRDPAETSVLIENTIVMDSPDVRIGSLTVRAGTPEATDE